MLTSQINPAGAVSKAGSFPEVGAEIQLLAQDSSAAFTKPSYRESIWKVQENSWFPVRVLYEARMLCKGKMLGMDTVGVREGVGVGVRVRVAVGDGVTGVGVG